MTLQLFPNGVGVPLVGGPNGGYEVSVPIAYTDRTVNAVGESAFSIGQLVWADGGTHTVSSSGGKMTLNLGSTTFANASTTLRAGIQDLSSGLEDGTFDVFDDLVGGTDALTTGLNTFTFSSGTKSIASGAFVAVGVEMTARGGADSVIIRSVSVQGSIPYSSIDTGSGPTRSATPTQVLVEADDGTIGWILGAPLPFTEDTINLSDTTTPDEVALIFQLPFPARVQVPIGFISPESGDSFDFKLYTNPLGTPSAQRAVSVDPNQTAQSGSINEAVGRFSPAYDLAANTLYAIALRATGTGLTLARITMASASHRAATPLGTNWSYGTRSNDTGAFSETTTMLPRLGLYVQAFDDGAGGGGSSGGAHIIGGTVIR